MAKKKVLITALALALVAIVAVCGTLAYLTAKANDGKGITNTFVAAGGGKLVDKFEIKETPVVKQPDGTYKKDPSASMSSSGIIYDIIPKQTLPKDPTLVLTDKTEVPSYLFCEVVENLDNIFEWSVDTSKWTIVSGVKGLNGGVVYVYTNGGATPVMIQKTATVDDFSYQILKDNQVKVKESADESAIQAASGDSLSFYGYLGQAQTGDTAKAVFEACGFAKKD